MKGPPYLLSLLPALSDDHEVLRLLKPPSDGERRGLSSSRKRRDLLFLGGSRSSADSAGIADEYRVLPLTAVRKGCVRDREEGWRAVVGRGSVPVPWVSWSRSSLPEFSRICGGLWR
jgi:hypothetical protein